MAAASGLELAGRRRYDAGFMGRPIDSSRTLMAGVAPGITPASVHLAATAAIVSAVIQSSSPEDCGATRLVHRGLVASSQCSICRSTGTPSFSDSSPSTRWSCGVAGTRSRQAPQLMPDDMPVVARSGPQNRTREASESADLLVDLVTSDAAFSAFLPLAFVARTTLSRPNRRRNRRAPYAPRASAIHPENRCRSVDRPD